MGGTLPGFEDVRGLIRRPKPPLAARVVQLQGDRVRRRAAVLYDGLEGWWIDDGERVELRTAEDRGVFVDDGRVERLGPGAGHVPSNDWVKVLLDGRRMADLDRARGAVVRGELESERWMWVEEVLGLEGPDSAPLRLCVDSQTGVLLRVGLVRGSDLLRVEELRIGTVQGSR